MADRPYYQCAKEVGFLPPPGESIEFAATGKIGFGQRVQEGDRFEFDGRPGLWMEPLNDPARVKCEEMVALGKRRLVAATQVASTEPIQSVRSGMSGSSILPGAVNPNMAHTVRDVATDARPPAPRRRAAATRN